MYSEKVFVKIRDKKSEEYIRHGREKQKKYE